MSSECFQGSSKPGEIHAEHHGQGLDHLEAQRHSGFTLSSWNDAAGAPSWARGVFVAAQAFADRLCKPIYQHLKLISGFREGFFDFFLLFLSLVKNGVQFLGKC